ncbi:hypothetical protein GCM10009624_23970 [Gordonia sinesedis]
MVGLEQARVADLAAAGRIQPAGHHVIDDAKARGLWTVLDDAEALIEHPDLTAALDADPAARRGWDACPASARKAALTRIALAKRPETVAARIAAIVDRTSRGKRPA